MSRSELIKYLPRLLSKKDSMPLYITYFVTNRCNLFCEHCFYSASLNRRTEELTLPEIEKMTAGMGHFPVLLYSGGEPFMRKDLVEVTEAFYRNCRIQYLSIPTNGSFLGPTEKMVARMCEICPDLTIVINFSVDGLEEEHNRIRGSNKAFGNAMRTFDAVQKLKGDHRNLHTGFVTTFTRSNQDNIDGVYEYLKSLRPDNVSINLIRGQPKNPVVGEIDILKFKAITARLEHDLHSGELPGYDEFTAAMGRRKYEMVIRTFEDDRFQSVCYASRIAGVIYPEGDVYPCELLDEDKKIGNIRDFNLDFRKLWLSERNRQIADWIEKTRCYCTHECNVHCNTAFNARHFAGIASEAAFRKVRNTFRTRG